MFINGKGVGLLFGCGYAALGLIIVCNFMIILFLNYSISNIVGILINGIKKAKKGKGSFELIELNVSGEVGFLVEEFNQMLIDIQKANDKIEKEQAKLRTTLLDLGEGIIVTDANNNIEFMNTVSERLTGWELDAAQGKSLKEILIISSEDDRAAESSLVDLFSTEELPRKLNGKFILRCQNGIDIPVKSTCSQVGDSKTCYLVIALQDLTEKQTHEERLKQSHLQLLGKNEKLNNAQNQLIQSQKIETIGSLAGGIAHDLNNILSIVKGYTEILLANEHEEEKEDSLQEILMASKRGVSLVKQILSFSRCDQHELVTIPITLIVKESIKMLRPMITANVAIFENIHNCPPVLSNPNHIHQVIFNLCINACHAMKESGGIITISLTTLANENRPEYLKEKDYVCLTIKDTGSGIPSEIKDKIFDPFFTTKEVEDGTGLGLFITRGVVEKSRGSIVVDTQVGVGTTFYIYLPVTDCHLVLNEDEIAPIRGNEKILIVDDDLTLLKLYQQAFTELGHIVTTSNDSKKSLDLLIKDPYHFDILITDQNMPNMNGLRLAEQVLKIREEMLVILISGYCDMDTKNSIESIGIKAFYDKPVSISQITQIIEQHRPFS